MEFDAEKHYLGKLCKHGHDWNATGQSLRRVADSRCVQCRIEYMEEYRRNNKERLLAQARQYKRRNRETVLVKQREWYERNRDYCLEYAKRYRVFNPEKVRKMRQSSDAKNPERVKAGKKKYRERNRRLLNFKQKERHYKTKRILGGYTEADILEHYRLFGDSCAYCGAKKPLTLDHFIPLSVDGSHCLHNIVPACLSCNASKNNSEAYTWYSRQPFFSKRRWNKILRVLGKSDPGQLPLL